MALAEQGEQLEHHQVVRVLLTGGPGAGKTSALATLRDRLARLGVQALLVPETATELLRNSGGYEPSWHGTPRHIAMQEVFMRHQLSQENGYIALAGLRPEKPAVLLCDRGLLEGRVFCSPEQWDECLRRLDTSDEKLLQRYDVIVHMKSTACGMENLYEYGPGSNNPNRFHTPEQARKWDEDAEFVHSSHPCYRVVENNPDFSQKIESVLEHVYDELSKRGIVQFAGELGVGPWDRVIIPVPVTVPADTMYPGVGFEWPVSREVFESRVTFLDGSFMDSIRSRHLVGMAEAGVAVKKLDVQDAGQYEYRREVRQEDGKTACMRQALSKDAYLLLQESRGKGGVVVVKRSALFFYNQRRFELSMWVSADGTPLGPDWDLHGYVILEMPSGVATPPFLSDGSVRMEEAVNNDGIVAKDSAELAAAPVVKEASPLAVATPLKRQSSSRILARHVTADAADVSARDANLRKKEVGSPSKASRAVTPAAAAFAAKRPRLGGASGPTLTKQAAVTAATTVTNPLTK